MSDPFTGEITMFAGNFAPRNYAFCDGQLLPIAQNTALFSLFGTFYGGDGRTTFGLPNLEGRSPMHSGGSQGPGLSPRPLGQRGGSATETLTLSQLPSHKHNVTVSVPCSSSASDDTDPTGRYFGDATEDVYANTADAEMAPATFTGDSVGGGGAHNNVHPVCVVNFIVALSGTYPSRS